MPRLDFRQHAEVEEDSPKPDFSRFAEDGAASPPTPGQDFSAAADIPPGLMQRLSAATGRVIDETVRGTTDTLRATNFGFRAETEKFFSDHGIVGPKPDDSPTTRLLKSANRTLLEGPVAALDAATAGFEGALYGLGQIAREFGASDTSVNKTIRDVNMFVTSKLGEGSTLLPRASVREQVLKDISPEKRTAAGAAVDAELERFARSIGEDPSAIATRTNLTRSEQLLTRITDNVLPARVVERAAEGAETVAPTGHQLRPYLELRLLKGTSELIEQVFETGPVRRDERKNIVFTGSKGLNDILSQAGPDTPNMMLYFAARGAAQIRKVRPDVQLPAGMDDAAIARVLALGESKPVFKKAFDEYQTFNREVLQLAVDSGRISAEQRKTFIEHRLDYVPAYRVVEDVTGGNRAGGSAMLRSLKGGPQNLAEISENLYRNTQMWVEASMRNYAKREMYDMIDAAGLKEFATPTKPPVRLGKALPADIAKLAEGVLPEDLVSVLQEEAKTTPVRAAVRAGFTEPNIDVVYRNGKPHFYEIHDSLLVEAMLGQGPQTASTALKIAAGAKTVFTRLVTMAPPFQVRNLIRDTQTAYMNFPSEYGTFVPVIDTMRGLWSRLTQNENYRLAMANGVGFSTLFKGEEALKHSAQVRPFYEKRGVDYSFVADTADKLAHVVEAGTSALELASRLRAFEKVAEKTGDLRLAGLEAREITTDFGKRGSSREVQQLASVVPFLNAGLQGVEKSGRTIGEHPIRTSARGIALTTIPTLIAYNAVKNDPDYWALPDWVRDLHWAIPDNFNVPGTQKTGFFLIPRGFEYGALFGAVPERIMEAVEQRHGSRFANAMLDIITNQFRLDPIPQLVKPLADQALNRQFPDRPIVTERLEGVRPSEQFSPYTSETLKGLAKILREDAGVEMSPARAEALVQGYFGTIGIYLLDGSDALARQFQKGEPPERRLDDRPLVRSFYTELPLKQSQFGTDFYTLLSETRKVTHTVQKMLEEAREPDLTKREEKLFGVAKAAEAVSVAIGGFNAETRRVYGSETMSGAEKRRRLDELMDARNKTFRGFMGQVPEDVMRDLGLRLQQQQ